MGLVVDNILKVELCKPMAIETQGDFNLKALCDIAQSTKAGGAILRRTGFYTAAVLLLSSTCATTRVARTEEVSGKCWWENG